MKKNPDAKRVLVNMSAEARARYLGATTSAVVVMAIRDAMEREGAKDRAPPEQRS